MGQWEFFRIPGIGDDPPFLWSWRCRQDGGTELKTGETFRYLLDCVAHARLHGYSNGPVQTQRDAQPTNVRRTGPRTESQHIRVG